jgi:hypothetical protein
LIIDSAANSPLLLLTYPPDDNIYLQFRQNYVFINQSQVNGLPDALNAKIGNNYASPVFNDGINLVLSNNGNTTSQISFYNSTSIVSSTTPGDIWSMGCNIYGLGVRKFAIGCNQYNDAINIDATGIVNIKNKLYVNGQDITGTFSSFNNSLSNYYTKI